jgi:oxygen-independent coproporphyrinogen III oxidase
LSHDTAIPVLRQQSFLTAGRPLGSLGPPGHGSKPRAPLPVRSLYIHVPFCFHKCHYCDFYSLVDTRDRQGPFVDRLVRELTALAPWAAGEPLRTVFVGGGTPSLLRPDLWRTLLRAIAALFDLSLIRTGGAAGEFTVECNPETVTPELMDVLVAGGVNRVSMGAQSFNPAHLKTLERWHNPENVERALATARAAGVPRQSIDLISGIPGQTLDQWRDDLDRALGLGTEHLSCYSLTYEPGTAMTARLRRGEFPKIDEDLEADMYELTVSHLRAHGLERYEVSNYARPGCEARHNMAYWRQDSWLAAGPSASAHVAGHRWKNAPRLDDYLSLGIEEGFSPITDYEAPDHARALSERIMTGVRLGEGLDAARTLDAAERLEAGAAEQLRRAVARQAAQGLLLESAGRWVLTDAGFMLADRVAVELMAALDARR